MSNKKKNKSKVNKTTLKQDRLFQKRLGAFIIDWVIIALLINIIVTFPRTLTSGVITTDTYFPNFPGNEGYVMGGIAFLGSYIYMVIFPLFAKETLGKKWMHIKVVNKNNTPAGFITRNIRFFITTICEPRLFNFSLVFYLLLSMLSGIYLGTVFEIISWALTIISGLLAIITKKGMIHDYVANTKVVVTED